MQTTNTTKRGFDTHSDSEMPVELGDVVDWYRQNLKLVPNLVRVMAGSPALLRSYWQTQQNLQQHGRLTPSENNVVQMSIARENTCRYCVAGHYLAGKVFFGTPEEVMKEISRASGLSDVKLEALRRFALRVSETRGRVSDTDVAAFLAAGYTRGQALDVVTNIAVKVMSNFTNQLAGTELDEAILPFAQGLDF